MKRRDFLVTTTATGLGVAGLSAACHTNAAKRQKGQSKMRAGFARVSITPPVGTTMMGFGGRDMDHGCEGIHDDIYVRALALEHDGEQAVIMGYDLCFLGREEADRFKGAIGRRMDLLPRQILLNTSHNHVGPSVGTWYSAGYEPPDRLYLNDLEAATLKAVLHACDAMRDVKMYAGVTRTALPLNRRRPNEDGQIENRPNPKGYVYDKLPICLFKDGNGKPVCLLFSISTHPSMMSGWQISAEYPGVAMRLLDEHFGDTVSLFLQGVGGDSKPSVIGRGVDRWQPGTWDLMEEAGGMVARETIDAIEKGLDTVQPPLKTASTEMVWRLEPTPSRAEFASVVASTPAEARAKDVHYMWAAKQLERLDRGDVLPTSATLTTHGVQIGRGLRIVGIEGEAVGAWGAFIDKFYDEGITFPLGYTDGTGLYLPTSEMLPEGGYEVVSSWEYGLPSRLASGMEKEVVRALKELRAAGIT